ncbi:hypothetical protein PYW07_002096 [Mythimna separata]|uniref:PiggyBac transposable element-derived protein domain-containing protein n=1 Tax=Mythimna separata TaxID=271217 RepID=A0AAD7YLN7_MYTSE|nr:hypothetical protein PYW07_002096 [Mythimna separata]
MAGNSNSLCDQIQRWLLEDNEDHDISSESEEGGELAEQSGPLGSPYHSDTEQDGEEVEDEDEDVPLSTLASYQSRNGTKWSKIAPPTSRTRSHNILVRPPGSVGVAKDAKTALLSFLLFFDADIWNVLVDSTNIYIDIIKSKYQRDRDASHTDVIEIKALIGINWRP